MLGIAVCAELGSRALGLTHAGLDVTDAAAVARALGAHQPVAIVNCAAWTDVDGAESHPAEAAALNAGAVGNLARAAAARGIYFITISTDYVFDGTGVAPWPEVAPPVASPDAEESEARRLGFQPLGVYGASKLAGERALMAAGGDWCLVRTQWLYGAGGRNFVDTIARVARERGAAPVSGTPVAPLRVVDDQHGAPTWVRDVARGLRVLIEQRARGVFHVVNSGETTWHGVAEFILRELALDCPLEPCGSDEFPRPARRPVNSRLSQACFAAVAGASLPDWQTALREYLGMTPCSPMARE
jgi:dTDP-4-dehydrorhamnose reductase